MAFLSGSVGRPAIIRFLMQLHAEGLLGEPDAPIYYGGPISVRGSG